ncbi:MAG: hypothetical protein E4G96_00445 [Chrysiogenales bacterium]|nr:MAG: hypothetical protein E4G96_00445 [Chrysiogenales bacterium]
MGGFSAHANRDGLLAWVGEIRNPDLKVFIVHGEERSAQAFAGTLKKELGLSPHVPDWGEKIDLSTMQSEHIVSGKPKLSERTDSEMELLSQSLKDLIEKYNLLKNRNKTVEIRKIREDINDLRKMISMIIDEM